MDGKELPESFVTAEDEGVFSVRDYPNARRIPPYKYYAKTHAETKQKPKRKTKNRTKRKLKTKPYNCDEKIIDRLIFISMIKNPEKCP